MNAIISASALAHESRETHNWAAKMISPLSDQGTGKQSSFVARDFEMSKTEGTYTLRISALGLYRAFINGKRVSNELLTPGWTCYDDRIAYQTYDISDHLEDGTNRIEIWLGDGWYRSAMMWEPNRIPNCWGSEIAALAEISEGENLVLTTNSDWQSGRLPIMQSGIYFGEDFDANIKPTRTHGVSERAFDQALFVAHEAGAVRELVPLKAKKNWNEPSGATIYDFGQNVGGYIRISVKGTKGATVRIEHTEVLGPNGEFDNRNYRSARAELRYTLSGEGEEIYAPVFTFMGYRFARVTIEGDASLTDIVSVPISSVPEQAGGFECDVEAVNRLVLNTIWSQRANFIEIPTDCPQRDERLGWTGDAQVFTGTACWLADSERFLKKFMRDVRHDQRPNGAIPHFAPDTTRLHPDLFNGVWAGATGWGDVITVTPWQLYLHYGDKSVLSENFPAMLKWLNYLWDLSDGPIIQPSSVWGDHGFTFGDWLQPVGDNRKPRPTVADDCAATLYHFISTELAIKIAAILGEDQAEAQLRERSTAIRTAFEHEYFSASGRLAHNDQTSYALAFLYDLVPDHHFDAAKAYFRTVVEDAQYLIGTGFIGTPALLPALTKLGMNDLAQGVFLNRKVPGWLYQVEQGATTIWERWDAIGEDGTIYDPHMNSYNHYAYGAVCQWLFEDVAGVSPTAEAPGFDRVRLAPTILPELGKVSSWHECRHGKITAGWTLKDAQATYTVDLPKGVTGELCLHRDYSNYQVNGDDCADTENRVTLGSGRHVITFKIKA